MLGLAKEPITAQISVSVRNWAPGTQLHWNYGKIMVVFNFEHHSCWSQYGLPNLLLLYVDINGLACSPTLCRTAREGTFLVTEISSILTVHWGLHERNINIGELSPKEKGEKGLLPDLTAHQCLPPSSFGNRNRNPRAGGAAPQAGIPDDGFFRVTHWPIRHLRTWKFGCFPC